MSVSPRRPSNMDPEWSSWTRASSGKSPVLPGPSSSRRPALLNRTTSAPAGGVYRLDDWNSAANTVNGANQMFIEKIESRSAGLGWEKVRPKNVSHSNDEVRFVVLECTCNSFERKWVVTNGGHMLSQRRSCNPSWNPVYSVSPWLAHGGWGNLHSYNVLWI
jgi:hypothetical protein